jgi:2-keto-4-pentenoate hydratase
MTISIQAAVERLIDARSDRRLLTPFSESHGDFTLGHAYAIQDALRLELDRRGERPIGWKLGATSPSGQAVMGVKEPACGFLFPGQYASGAAVSVSGFASLAVEAEVAFRMRTELAGPGVTAATALLAVEGGRGDGQPAERARLARQPPTHS